MIARTFAATPGLALVRSLQTELYRVDLLRKTETASTPRFDGGQPGSPPEPACSLMSMTLGPWMAALGERKSAPWRMAQ